jgi:acetyl-CoA C-acetyltransferase
MGVVSGDMSGETEAYVVGAGQSAFGAFPGETDRTLFATAVEAAFDGVDLDRGDVEEVAVGTLGVGGRQLGLAGPALAEFAGLGDVPCTRVENACAAGGYAVRSAVRAVESGAVDVALAGGVEVMTDLSADRERWWLGVSGDTAFERLAGTTFAGVYAQMASAHFAEHGTTREHMSWVAAKNHRNGADNPDAHLDFERSIEDAETAPTVAEPLSLVHCCPTSDGAAAVVVASREVAEELSVEPVLVAGVGAASDAVGLHQRDSYTSIPAARRATERARRAAGFAPESVDLAEVHDCFAIAELLAYEDLGLCEPGEAGRLVETDATAANGDLPVNLSGGLGAKGHPIGATGVAQVVEVCRRLAGDGDGRGPPDPERAVTHNVGGSGGAAVVGLFERGLAPETTTVEADDDDEEIDLSELEAQL